MIGKIAPALGARPSGLLSYLFGPGRRNEHRDPHLVAAAEAMAADSGWRPDGRGDVFALSRQLDRPHWLHRSDRPGGYLWHASLSLPAEDGALSDQTWNRIAAEVVERMGFGEGSGHAPTRWIAVRHGRSAGGYDHIHLVVNLVREDGTRASNWRDRPRLSKILGQIEREYGLSIIGGRGRGAALPGVTYAESEIARRSGAPEPARAALARIVRAAAGASADEAEFVRRLRATPVLRLRPRYGQGGRDAVVGYSVALTPRAARPPVWFGGGRLAPDLSLPALRARWGDDPLARAAGLAAWNSTGRPGREGERVSAEAWAQAAERIAAASRALAQVPVEDLPAWTVAAREAAGVYAALSLRLEGARPGALARAAAALSYSAQLRAPREARAHPVWRDFRGAAMTALQAGPVRRSNAGQLLLQQQMLRLLRVLHEAHRARGDAVEAARLERVARDQLRRLHPATETNAPRTPAAAAAIRPRTHPGTGRGEGR